jgi:hypothetical protein
MEYAGKNDVSNFVYFLFGLVNMKTDGFIVRIEDAEGIESDVMVVFGSGAVLLFHS